MFDPNADPDDAVTSGVIETAVDPAPEGAFNAWRTEVIRRLTEFHDWYTEEEHGTQYFWSTEFGWQVEVHADSITMLWRKGNGAGGSVEEQAFMDALAGLDMILNASETQGWIEVDDPTSGSWLA